MAGVVREKLYLTPLQLGARWQLSTRTLSNWRCQGHGPAFFKVGGAIRYPLSAVVEYEKRFRGGGFREQAEETVQ
ncbi:MAG: helix-turn-helix domain-containing protein [bacterium]|nr:helix-turn-helix domain-containing protein [bacterium]